MIAALIVIGVITLAGAAFLVGYEVGWGEGFRECQDITER